MAELTPEQKRRIAALRQPKRSIVTTNLTTIVPRSAVFLWWPYLPLGKVVIVAGAPGHGKSQLSALIAAMASRGSLYPGDVLEPSRVLMLCAEDSLDDTVVPRLLAVNADLRMIDTINTRVEYPDGLTANGLIRIPGDVGHVHAWARDNVDARLVVLDPVASFFSREHNALLNQDVRDALGPLVAVAESYGVTIVVILHLNKSESKEFAARISESHGFQALARSVLALGPDPDDPQRDRGSKKVLAITKANLIKPGSFSLRCEVRSVTLTAFTPPIETSELVLLGKCDISADDLLMPSQERVARMEVADWLEALLDGGWRKVGDVRKAGISDGFHWRVIDRVARAMDYQRIKQPGIANGPWWLGAPKAHARAIPGYQVPSDSSEPSTPQGTEGTEGSSYRGITREGDFDSKDNGKPVDLDEYRRFEQRKLGERDDDD